MLGFDPSGPSSAILEIIKEVDDNGDGEIQFDEFCAMMKKLAT